MNERHVGLIMDENDSVAYTTAPPTFEKANLFKLHEKLCAKGLEIMKAKNADYSKAHPLGNFMLSEALQTCSAENGIINRMGDKLSRLVSVLAKGAQVKDESIEDTIIDVINYSVLLAAVIEYKKKQP